MIDVLGGLVRKIIGEDGEITLRLVIRNPLY